jgi:hypothetical protein
MKKVILVLMVSAAALMADGIMYGVSAGYANVSSSGGTTNDVKVNEDTQSLTAQLKAGYENDAARGFVFIGKDRYENDNDAKYYGFEFDKKFNDAYVGVLLAFGKIGDQDNSFRDIGAKVGYDFKVTESSYIDTGVKAVRREYKVGDAKDNIIGAYIGINFN